MGSAAAARHPFGRRTRRGHLLRCLWVGERAGCERQGGRGAAPGRQDAESAAERGCISADVRSRGGGAGRFRTRDSGSKPGGVCGSPLRGPPGAACIPRTRQALYSGPAQRCRVAECKRGRPTRREASGFAAAAFQPSTGCCGRKTPLAASTKSPAADVAWLAPFSAGLPSSLLRQVHIYRPPYAAGFLLDGPRQRLGAEAVQRWRTE